MVEFVNVCFFFFPPFNVLPLVFSSSQTSVFPFLPFCSLPSLFLLSSSQTFVIFFLSFFPLSSLPLSSSPFLPLSLPSFPSLSPFRPRLQTRLELIYTGNCQRNAKQVWDKGPPRCHTHTKISYKQSHTRPLSSTKEGTQDSSAWRSLFIRKLRKYTSEWIQKWFKKDALYFLALRITQWTDDVAVNGKWKWVTCGLRWDLHKIIHRNWSKEDVVYSWRSK